MSRQFRQSFEREGVGATSGAVRESSLKGFETRNLQAADQGCIDRRFAQRAVVVERRGRHTAIVPSWPASTEVQTDPGDGSIGVHSLDVDALVCSALRAADLSHGQGCAYMADEDGKPLDPSLWTRMRRDGNLPIGRMRKLPIAFWRHFIVGLAEAAEMNVSNADIADIAVQRVATAFEAVADAFRHMRKAG